MKVFAQHGNAHLARHMHLKAHRQHDRAGTRSIVAPGVDLGDGQLAPGKETHQRQHEVVPFQRHGLDVIGSRGRLRLPRGRFADGNLAAGALGIAFQRRAHLVHCMPVAVDQQQGAEAVPQLGHTGVPGCLRPPR